MPGIRQFSIIIIAACTFAAITLTIQACPYCPRTESTLCEKLAQSEIACLVRFISSGNGVDFTEQWTKFSVVASLPKENRPMAGDVITIPIGVTAEKDDQFLLMGQILDTETRWNLPIPVDELGTELKYILNAPPLESPQIERLTYFWKFLDSKIPLIANDAFGEFSRAPFNEVKLLAPMIEREKVREWLADPNPQLDVRRDFYGMVLGLCGNEDDAAFLEQKILAPIPPDRNRLGIGGMMSGYLMLRGPAGLHTLVANKIDAVPDNLPPDDPRIGEMNELRGSLVFMWDYRREQFDEELLRETMRRYLGMFLYAESAIKDLSRWKDWASLEQLIRGYGRSPWENRSGKVQVVAFALSCLKDTQHSTDPKRMAYANQAREFLQGLDQGFVKTVRQTFGGLSASADAEKADPQSTEPRE